MLDHHSLNSIPELAENAWKALGYSLEKIQVNRLTDLVVRRGSERLASVFRLATARHRFPAALVLSAETGKNPFAGNVRFGTVIDWQLTEYMRQSHSLDNATPSLLRRESFVDVVSARLGESRRNSRKNSRYRIDEFASLISLAHGIFVALRFSGSIPLEKRSYWLRRATGILNRIDYDELPIGVVDGTAPFSRGINLRGDYQAAIFEHSLAIAAVGGFRNTRVAGCDLKSVLPPRFEVPQDVALWTDIVRSRRAIARADEADTVRSQLEAERRIKLTKIDALAEKSSREEYYQTADPTQTAKSRFHTTVGDKAAVDALSALTRALREGPRVGSRTLATAKECLSRSHHSYMSSEGTWWHCYAHHLMVRALYASVVARQSSTYKFYQQVALDYISTAEAAFFRTNDLKASQRASAIKTAIAEKGSDWLQPGSFQETFFGAITDFTSPGDANIGE